MREVEILEPAKQAELRRQRAGEEVRAERQLGHRAGDVVRGEVGRASCRAACTEAASATACRAHLSKLRRQSPAEQRAPEVESAQEAELAELRREEAVHLILAELHGGHVR